jgi:thiol-disulfide isomerase/thioredoxin
MISPKFAEFSSKYNATFIHVDVDEVGDHPDVQGVSGVPHFKFFKNGALITEFSGIYSPFSFYPWNLPILFTPFFDSLLSAFHLPVHKTNIYM